MSAFGRFLARPTTGEFLRRALAEDRAQASADLFDGTCVCGFSIREHRTADGDKLTCDHVLGQRIKALAQVCLCLSQSEEQSRRGVRHDGTDCGGGLGGNCGVRA